jgi:glutamate racemase
MAGLLDQPGGENIDTIVLACTHFPLVRDELAAAAGRPISFVDGAEGIARRTEYLLAGTVWPPAPVPGRVVFTAKAGDIDALAPALHSFGLDRLEFL